RLVAAHRETDRGADVAGLRQRGVDDSVAAEVLLQPVGDPAHAAERADVLTHEEHLGALLERLAQTEVDRLGEGDGGHRWLASPSRNDASYPSNHARSDST